YLFAHSAYFNFAAERNNKALPPNRDWQPGPDVLGDFRAWLEKEKIGTAAEQEKAFADAATRDFILRQIRAEMFNGAFGLEAGHQVIAGGDKQIQTALHQFDKAATLLAERQDLSQARAQKTAFKQP